MTRRQRVQATVDGRMFTTVMTIATVYALFGDDMRIAWFPKDADILFVVFSSIAFFLFAQELLLQCYAKPGYLGMPRCKRENLVCNRKEWRILNLFSIGSFYFWLDVIATASLVPEVPSASGVVSAVVYKEVHCGDTLVCDFGFCLCLCVCVCAVPSLLSSLSSLSLFFLPSYHPLHPHTRPPNTTDSMDAVERHRRSVHNRLRR